MEKFDIVNILRVIATFMVFFMHSLIPDGARFLGKQVVYDYSWTFIFRSPAWGGVWIFFILSGYLAANSFLRHRYSFSVHGIRNYWLQKIRNVWFPTVVFFVVITFLCVPAFFFKHPTALSKLLCCTFDGNQSPHKGIGATWFVFTLMWFYFMTPVLVAALQKIRRYTWLVFGFVICSGLGGRLYCYQTQCLNWYDVYTGVFTNLDLYFGGICIAFLLDNGLYFQKGRLLGGGGLLFLLLLNTAIAYFYPQPDFLVIYRYYLPSVYLLLVGLILCAFQSAPVLRESKIWKCFNWFASCSFEFYLFHSLVLVQIAPFIGGHSSLQQYSRIVIPALAITFVFAKGFQRLVPRQKAKT